MTMKMKDEIREKLAEYAHAAWSGWMEYLFSKGDISFRLENKDYVWIMPNWALERWQRQMKTLYAELNDSEKDSDRAEADKILAILKAARPERAHTIEEDFEHFLHYSGFSTETPETIEKLRKAFAASWEADS